MSYNPQSKTREILDIAWQHIQSVPYTVTARWLFYRLLQAAILQKKSDYKLLLKVLSSARKGFYNGWAPDTLADDTRQAMIKGAGWRTGNHWLDGVKRMSCELDRWTKQDNYVEVWFEAAAMTSQFDHYTNGNVPLLAFHGDISIPEKWESAKRLKERYDQLGVPIVVLSLESFGWRDTAFASGIIVLLVGLSLAQVIRRRPEDYGMELDGGPAAAIQETAANPPVADATAE